MHAPAWPAPRAGLALLLTATLFCPRAARAASAPAASPDRTGPADDEVLERVRPSGDDPQLRQARALRLQLQQKPGDLETALRLARLYLELGRERSDPRFGGRAASVLSPWTALPHPPEPVRVLRAILNQRNHAFGPAVEELREALLEQPGDAQARLVLASVQTVLGDYTAARASCLALSRAAPRLVVTACLTGVSSLTGRLEASRGLLERALEVEGAREPGQEAWIHTSLGEMAQRGGDAKQAEAEYRRGLALDAADPYLLGALADLLLEQGRPAEVVELLRGQERADGLLLRLALAEKRLGLPIATAHIKALGDRFEASHQRGDSVHRREEARFELWLRERPAEALQLARANWDVQREPADARILLEAAIGAGSPEAARPVIEFLHGAHTEDAGLARLEQKLGALR